MVTAAWYLTFGFMWLVCAGFLWGMVHWRRLMTGAARDAALAGWARTTMISVTDRTGIIYAATLAQLHTDVGDIDRVWGDPIAVSVWHPDPELYAMELRQAKALDPADWNDRA